MANTNSVIGYFIFSVVVTTDGFAPAELEWYLSIALNTFN